MKIIQKIEVRHFRSIHDQAIEQLSDLNIFGGQNDSGKSNVLKALNLFFNNETSFLEEFDFSADFSMLSKIKARESKKGRQFISLKIYFNSEEIKGKSGLKKLAEKNGGLWVERRWWAYSPDGSYDQILPEFIKTADQGVKRSFSMFLQSIKFAYIPALKNEEVFSYILKLSAKNKGLFLSDIAKKELDENIAKTTKEFSRDFSDLTNIKTSVTLPISLETFWSSLEVNSQFEGTPEVIKRGDFTDYQIKFTSRGEGIKSIFIPVILGWLSKKAKSDHWIWGIDEPENALEALRADNLFNKFVEYSKHSQIFVSTHSPSFLFPNKGGTNVCVFITKQDNPGDTKFSKITDDTSEFNSLFGYDYGSFLKLQSDYSTSISDQERLKDENEFLRKLATPILVVEGQTDETILTNAWSKLYPSVKIPFLLLPKGCAGKVSYFLENAAIFPNRLVIGLFDFDSEGFQKWNGLSSHGYQEVTTSTPETCLTRKRGLDKHYALLLPVPTNGEVRNLVISSTGDHFCDQSAMMIELLFHSVQNLNSYFEKVAMPGNGQKIIFKGNKTAFAKKTNSFDQDAFENFKPLFDTIKALIHEN